MKYDELISKIQERNAGDSLLPKQEKESNSLLKNVGFGIINGTKDAALFLPMLGEGLVRAGSGAISSIFDDDVSLKEGLLKGLTENKTLELSNKTDESLRDLFNIKSYEDDTGTDQVEQLTGELLPILASGGTTGLIKVGNVLAKKAAKSAAKKAIKQGLTKEATKSAMEKAVNRSNFVTGMALPGVQITKNAPLKQKLVEGTLQTALPVGFNDLGRYINKQQGILGDYREPEKVKITLLPDKRTLRNKKYLSQIPEDKVQTYTLDNTKEESNFLSEHKTGIALGTAALLSPKAARSIRKYIGSKEVENLAQKVINETVSSEVLANQVDFAKRINPVAMSDAIHFDRFRVLEEYANDLNIPQEIVNKIRSNNYDTVNGAFHSGKISGFGDDIVLEVSPERTFFDLRNLSINSPDEYNNINTYLNVISDLQDETNRYNTAFMKGKTELSPKEYVSKRINEADIASAGLTRKEQFIERMKNFGELKRNIDNNPKLKQILKQISDISRAEFEIMKRSGQLTSETIAKIEKNRSFDDLFLYKQVKPKQETTLVDNIVNTLFNKEDTLKTNSDNIFNYRGGVGIKNQEDYINVLEESFKKNLLDALDNADRKQFLTLGTKKSLDKTVKIAREADRWFHSSNIDDATNEYFANIYDTYIKALGHSNPIQYLGSKDFENVNSIYNIEKTFFQQLNTNDVYNGHFIDKANQMYDPEIGRLEKLVRNNPDEIMSFKDNGKVHYYKVPKIIKNTFDYDARLPSVLGDIFNSVRKAVQTTYTGNLFNPMFAITRSPMYSLHENVLNLYKIGQNLGIKDASIIEYLKETGKVGKELFTKKLTEFKLRDLDNELTKIDPTDMIKRDNLINNAQALQQKLKADLLTDVESLGGNNIKPLNKADTFNTFILNKNVKFSDELKTKLSQKWGESYTRKALSLINILQDTMREAPNISFSTYLGKKYGAIKNNRIVNKNLFNDVKANIAKHTTTTQTRGLETGVTGKVVKSIRNYLPFGDVAVSSLGSKLHGINGVRLYNLMSDLYDPKIRFVDVLRDIGKAAKDVKEDSFTKGIFNTIIIPSTLCYLWNNQTQENRNAYYSLSNYNKSRGLVLSNVFGRNVIIPQDQEAQILSTIYMSILDNVFGYSGQQTVDPNFKGSNVVSEALARSLQLDANPLINIGMHTLGYDLDTSALFRGVQAIRPLKNVTNADMSETAIENGALSAETTKILEDAGGNFGKFIAQFIEEFAKDTSVTSKVKSVAQNFADNITAGGRLWTTGISTYNATSRAVYSKGNLINNLTKIKNKSPMQQKIYQLVLDYKRNMIDPVHNEIKSIRKDLATMIATGRYNDQDTTYNQRQDIITETNKKLINLYALEFRKYKMLDKLLQQQYGNGITLENFMQQFNGR